MRESVLIDQAVYVSRYTPSSTRVKVIPPQQKMLLRSLETLLHVSLYQEGVTNCQEKTVVDRLSIVTRRVTSSL